MIHFLLSSDEMYKFMYNDVRKIPNVLTSERRRKKNEQEMDRLRGEHLPAGFQLHDRDG